MFGFIIGKIWIRGKILENENYNYVIDFFLMKSKFNITNRIFNLIS